jgi:hypothetical protein
MCLSVTVEFVGIERNAVHALIADLPSADLLHVELVPKRWFGSSVPCVGVSEGGGCACSLLTDAADWNAPTWSMESSLLPKLAHTVRVLGRLAAGPMVLEARWSGDSSSSSVTLSLEELSTLAEQGQLGTHTRYIVPGADDVTDARGRP